MSFVGAFILTANIAVSQEPEFYIPNPEQPNFEREAIRTAGKAIYKQYNLKSYVKKYEKRYVNEDIKKYGLYIAICTRLVTEKRFSVEWTF